MAKTPVRVDMDFGKVTRISRAEKRVRTGATPSGQLGKPTALGAIRPPLFILGLLTLAFGVLHLAGVV